QARGPSNPPRTRNPVRADRHADHGHRGDPDRERNRGQHELEPRADAVTGQNLRAETRQHMREDADAEHRLQRRETGDGSDFEDVDEHRPSDVKSPDPGNDARPAGKQIPPHHSYADEVRDQGARGDAAHAELRDRTETEAERAAKNDLTGG